MTKEEIKTKYKTIHDEMTAEFYPLKRAGLVDDELQAIFVASHEQNWADMKAELIAEGYLIPPEPVRDLAAEIDELKAEIKELKDK